MTRYALWRDLWDAGHTAQYIAQVVGLTVGTVDSTIAYYRQSRGWFPRRRSFRRPRQLLTT